MGIDMQRWGSDQAASHTDGPAQRPSRAERAVELAAAVIALAALAALFGGFY